MIEFANEHNEVVYLSELLGGSAASKSKLAIQLQLSATTRRRSSLRVPAGSSRAAASPSTNSKATY